LKDRVFNGFRGTFAVTYDDALFDAQKRRAAIFVVVRAFFDYLKDALHQDGASDGDRGFFRFVFNKFADSACDTFAGF